MVKVMVLVNGEYYPFTKGAPGRVISSVIDRLSVDGKYEFDIHYVLNETLEHERQTEKSKNKIINLF